MKALDISQATFEEILVIESTSDNIYELASSFRASELPIGEAMSNHCYIARQADSIGKIPNCTRKFVFWRLVLRIRGAEIGFLFKYPELRNRESKMPWSIRQTAMMSNTKLSPSSQSTWLLLHPLYETALRARMSAAVRDPTVSADWHKVPTRAHIFALRTYVGNWRAYLGWIEEDLLNLVGTV